MLLAAEFFSSSLTPSLVSAITKLLPQCWNVGDTELSALIDGLLERSPARCAISTVWLVSQIRKTRL